MILGSQIEVLTPSMFDCCLAKTMGTASDRKCNVFYVFTGVFGEVEEPHCSVQCDDHS